MQLKNKITELYQYTFDLSKLSFVAIYISARCKSKEQLNSQNDEDLRVEIDGAQFREIYPEKNIQLFNVPPAFNGSQLLGLKKIVVFLSVLEEGKHTIDLIPQNSAFVEEIKIQELSSTQDLKIEIQNQAEDGDRRPWFTFVLIDLPLKYLIANITAKWRFRDSDEVKLIIDGQIQKNTFSLFRRNWLWSGSIFKKLFQKETQTQTIESNLSQGTHYIEFWADRTPLLNEIKLNLNYFETNAEVRAGNLIKEYRSIIKNAAAEFGVNPEMVGAAIYQEQATNVNFIDILTDYIGGLLRLNTSIGIGQVRVRTAEHLEKQYPQLYSYRASSLFLNDNAVRVARLKDPLTNIRYVAAKIHFTQERWSNAGFDIKNKPEILGTLYNIEDVANPIEPHASPTANEFGRGVKENYGKIKVLLGL